MRYVQHNIYYHSFARGFWNGLFRDSLPQKRDCDTSHQRCHKGGDIKTAEQTIYQDCVGMLHHFACYYISAC